MGYRELPGSLGNALAAEMENSELVAEALGSMCSTSSCATSAASGRTTAAT